MDITFSCSHCGQTVVIDEAGSGMSVDCPQCAKPIYVPTKPRSLQGPAIQTTNRLPPVVDRKSPSAPITLSGHDLALTVGESVILQKRQHGVIIVLPLIMSLVLGVGIVLLDIFVALAFHMVFGVKVHSANSLILLLPFLFLGGVVSLLAWLSRKNSLVTLTSRRLIINQGLLSKTTADVLLKQIETVAIRRPLLGRMFGYGTVLVRGTGGGRFCLSFIERPDLFYSKLQKCVEGFK